MIYFDSTFIAKLYLRERESDAIRTLVRKTEKTIVSSILGKMETEATFHRKLREQEITGTQMRSLHQQFQEDIQEERVKWIPIGQPIIDLVESTFLELPPDVFLRTGDAIHLATAADFGLKEIYSNDRHLLGAATIFQLKGVNPPAK